MKKSISVSGLIAYCIKNITTIAVISAICAMALGTVVTVRDYQKAGSVLDEDKYLASLDEYQKRISIIDTQIAAKENSISYVESYVDNSYLMKINPYDEYVYSINYVISLLNDIDYHQVIVYDESPSNYMLSRIEKVYLAFWDANDLSGFDEGAICNTDKYIKEMIQFTAEDGVISISIKGKDADEAYQLASRIKKDITGVVATVNAVTFEHKLTLITEESKNVVDDELAIYQTNKKNSIRYLMDELNELKVERNAIRKPVNSADSQKGINFRKSLMAVFIGGVVGIFGAAFIIMLNYLYTDKVWDKDDIIETTNLSCLGEIRTSESVCDRVINKVLNVQPWNNPQEAIAYSCKKICSMIHDDSIIIVSTLPAECIANELEVIKSEFEKSGKKIQVMVNALQNEDLWGEGKKMVMVEKRLVSSSKWIKKLNDEVSVSNSDILGVLIVG